MNNTRTEMLTTKVEKLDDDVRQCAGALNDIKVTLAAMDSKYDHILSLLPDKGDKKGLPNNVGNLHGQVQTCIARLDFPKSAGDNPTSWIYKAEQFFR